MRRAVWIGAGLLTAALVARVLIPSAGDPRPANASSRAMTAVRAGDRNEGSLRFIPPAGARCAGRDITIAAIPQAPGWNGSTVPALASVQSRRTCQLQQNGEVTPVHPSGKPAAPAVILAPPGTGDLIIVGPGHAVELEINWASGEACAISPRTSPAELATSFSYNIAGVKGLFQLRQPVGTCPMAAFLMSNDAAVDNKSSHGPITLVAVTAPARVSAGAGFIAHAVLYYQSTTTAVFNPCPVFWARISPQSAPATTSSWALKCASMAPLRLGDVINFDIPLTVPANLATQTVDLDIGFGTLRPAGPQQQNMASSGPDANTQLMVQGVGAPLQPVVVAPLPPPQPPIPLQRVLSPACAPSDLRPGDLAPHQLVPGAGVHSDYFTLTNIGPAPCTLYKNAPVVLEGPNLARQPLPSGDGAASLFGGTVDGELEAGQTTQVQFEFSNYCAPADETAAAHFSDVVIDLPAGPLVVPRPIDASCGASTGGAGVNTEPGEPTRSGAAPLYEFFDPTQFARSGSVDIKAPPTFPRGVPTTIEITLHGQADWSAGCPGYAITLGQTQTRHGLPCTTTHILGDIPATYQIQVEPPPTAPLGPTTIRFELLCGLVPTVSQSVTITPS